MEFCDECGALIGDGECEVCEDRKDSPTRPEISEEDLHDCPRCGSHMFRDIRDSKDSDQPGQRKHGSQPVGVIRKCPDCGFEK